MQLHLNLRMATGFITDLLISLIHMLKNSINCSTIGRDESRKVYLINYTQINIMDACNLWYPETFSTYTLPASSSFSISVSTQSSCFASILIRSWQVLSLSLQETNRLFIFYKFFTLSEETLPSGSKIHSYDFLPAPNSPPPSHFSFKILLWGSLEAPINFKHFLQKSWKM